MVKDAREKDIKKYTRPLGLVRDMVLGFGGMAAATAVGIADPAAGVALFLKSKKAIDSHRTLSRAQRRNNVYKVPVGSAEQKLLKAKEEYAKALNKYTNNQFDYEQELRSLEQRISKI